MNDERTLHKVVVLYADVSGSTKLYEQYGDELARADIACCLNCLSAVAEEHGGMLLKTIGDEIMCTFPIPQRALAAAVDMHQALRQASEEGKFATGSLRVKIGFHYGIAEWRSKDLVGSTPAIGQQVIGLAKPEEVLASDAALDALPQAVRDAAQLISNVESAADGQAIAIYKLTWEESEDATQYSIPARAAAEPHSQLILQHQSGQFVVDEHHRHCRLGRVAGNDIVTDSHFTSRRHAEIIYRHGRFHLKDNSVNGTVVSRDGAQARHLHREEGLLEGQGQIFLGGKDDASRLRYRCVSMLR